MIGAGVAAFAWLKKRNATHGSAGALPSPMVDVAPINPEPNRMTISQTPPVTSEMSLGMRSDTFVQRPLQPAAVWNNTGTLSQGSGTPIADDGRAFLPAVPARTVPIADVGVQPLPAPMQPQPAPVQTVSAAPIVAAPEVAAPLPKVQPLPAETSGPTWERGVLVYRAEV
jgi:hypothetical protein